MEFAGNWSKPGQQLEPTLLDQLHRAHPGSMAGLAPMLVWIGTRDVLLPDARRLRKDAAASGVPVEYREYPGMIHNWPMRRLPEAGRAMDELTELLRVPEPTAGQVR